MAPLLDAIVARVPPPRGDPSAPFALLVAMVEHDAFLGPVATGRVAAGVARVGDRVQVLHHSGARPLRHLRPLCLQRGPASLVCASKDYEAEFICLTSSACALVPM